MILYVDDVYVKVIWARQWANETERRPGRTVARLVVHKEPKRALPEAPFLTDHPMRL